jgi:hypothetical protein
MLRSDVIAAIQVALFLFGSAWLDRAFEGYHVPPLVAEVHKQPDADAPSLDDGDQDIVGLTVPQASMPIGNRFVHAEPQAYRSRLTPQDDNWWMSTSPVLLQHIAKELDAAQALAR